LAGGAGGELGRGASSAVVVALEGGRRARVRFGDGYGSAKRGGGIFPTLRELPALLIGSCRVEAGAGAPTIYLGSNGRRHKFRLTDSAPILPPGPKTAPTRGWEVFWEFPQIVAGRGTSWAVLGASAGPPSKLGRAPTHVPPKCRSLFF
jgi:hypothetical protein